MLEKDYEIEYIGYQNGENPIAGEWYHKFNFEPIPYSNENKYKKEDFRKKFQKELKNKFIFYGEVSVTIILYFNEEKKLERLKYGDLDNYAKMLLDCMKGKNGLFIDDCQVQHLDISWIDIPSAKSYFEITIKSLPDAFLRKPIKLYEMPDKLYYPISLYTTDKKELIEILCLLYSMINNKVKIKHKLRKEKKSELEVFHLTALISPIIMGFHKSHIIDSGYKLVEMSAYECLEEKTL